MIFVVSNDIPRELLLHLFGVDTLNVNLFDLIFTDLLIIGFVIEGSRLSLDVELTEFHFECVGHLAFELPQFLVVVDLDNDVGLVGTESDLDLLEFILGVLTLVLLEDVVSVEARDIALDQLQTVQLVVLSLTRLLDVLETPVGEDLVDRLLLIRCLRLDVQVQVHQEVTTLFSHSLNLTLNRDCP